MCLKFSFFIKIYDFFFLNEAKTNSFYMDESHYQFVVNKRETGKILNL